LTVTGVVVALPGEFRALSRRQPLRNECIHTSARLWLVLCGTGPERARVAARSLLAAGAEALVSWGSAAGLEPDLSAGTLLLAEAVEVTGHIRYQVDLRWRDHVRARLTNNIAFVEGAIAATPTVLDCPEQKSALFHATQALAADMESGAVAEVAQQTGKPFIVVRAVSDPAQASMPTRVLRETDGWGGIPLTSVITAVARNPRELVNLLQLGTGYYAALRTLTRTARCLGVDGLSKPLHR
jgi:adenosylhomocysteine nucleosidase